MIAGNSTGMDGLVGRNMVVMCNLKERTFFGVASSVMLLFSTDESDKVGYALILFINYDVLVVRFINILRMFTICIFMHLLRVVKFVVYYKMATPFYVLFDL